MECGDPAPALEFFPPQQCRSTEANKGNKDSIRGRKWLKWALAVGACCVTVGLGVWYLLAPPGPNSQQLMQEGWQLLQRGSLQEALPKFSRAAKLDSRNAEVWNGLGWANFNCGKWQEAEHAFQQSLILNPNHPAALNGLGQLCLVQRKHALAESYLLKASACGPTNLYDSAPAPWYALARLYLIEGKFDKAEEWAKKIIDSGHGDEFARQLLQAARTKQVPPGPASMANPEMGSR